MSRSLGGRSLVAVHRHAHRAYRIKDEQEYVRLAGCGGAAALRQPFAQRWSGEFRGCGQGRGNGHGGSTRAQVLL